MNNIKNIVYLIQGMSPNLSSGGPFRIVAMLLSEFMDKTENYHTHLITKNGIIEDDYIKKNYTSPEFARNRERKSFGTKIHEIIKSILSDQLKLYLSITNNEKNVLSNWEKCVASCHKSILHSHLNTGASKILAARNNKYHKVIVTYHSKGSIISDYCGSWNLKKDSRFANNLSARELYEIKNADVITFPSKGAYELMKYDRGDEVFSDRDVRIVYNGVDIAMIDKLIKKYPKYELSDKPFTILNVAQHVSQKRIDIILKAVSVLKNRINIKLINIGDGPLLHANIQLARDLLIEDIIDFRGRCSNENVIELMASCDLFVMPSENIVFDMITLEAMASCLPVVVTADGGNLECIRDGIDGILTKKNDIGSVVEAINLAYYNKDKVIEISRSARKRVEKEFSIDSMANRYESIYDEIYPR